MTFFCSLLKTIPPTLSVHALRLRRKPRSGPHVEAVRDKQRDRSFNLRQDLAKLVEKLKEIPDAKLIIIDPIRALSPQD